MFLDDLEPREEEQEDEADVGEELDVGVGLRDVEHLGADQDPEHDLDHDGREDDTVVNPREDRTRRRRGEHEDERAEVRRRHAPG